MKRMIFLFSLLLSGVLSAQTDPEIQIEISGLSGMPHLYVVGYHGNVTYIMDTVAVKEGGKVVIRPNEKEDMYYQGVFALTDTAQNQYFDFLYLGESFSMKTTLKMPIQSMVVTGSKENSLYFDYIKEFQPAVQEAMTLQEQMSIAQRNKDLASQQNLGFKIQGIQAKVKELQTGFMASHPDAFVSKMIKVNVIPDGPVGMNRQQQMYYYRDHYFDNVDFTDPRLVHTPKNVIYDKLEFYMDKMNYPDPDSALVAADNLLALAKEGSYWRSFLLEYLTSKYRTPQRACHDRVFVHVIDTYFKGKTVPNFPVEQIQALLKRAEEMRPVLCGNTVPNITMWDQFDKPVSLYDIKADFTVMLFWSSDCKHCKEAMPDFIEFYKQYKSQGVEIFGVNTEWESEGFKKYLMKNQLEWVNVQDTAHKTKFREVYDVFQTPVVYLLDKNKKMITKNISPPYIIKTIEGIRSGEIRY